MLLPGCGAGTDAGSTSTSLVYLLPTDPLLTTDGDSVQLVPEDSSGNRVLAKSLNWSSSDTSIATVDSQGKVTSHSDGTALIAARQPLTGYNAFDLITVSGYTQNSSNDPNTTSIPPIPTSPIPTTPGPDPISRKR